MALLQPIPGAQAAYAPQHRDKQVLCRGTTATASPASAAHRLPHVHAQRPSMEVTGRATDNCCQSLHRSAVQLFWPMPEAFQGGPSGRQAHAKPAAAASEATSLPAIDSQCSSAGGLSSMEDTHLQAANS